MTIKFCNCLIFVFIFAMYSFSQEQLSDKPEQIEIIDGKHTIDKYIYSYKDLSKKYGDIKPFKKQAKKSRTSSTIGDVFGGMSLGFLFGGLALVSNSNDSYGGALLIVLSAPLGLVGIPFKILSKRSKRKSIDKLNRELREVDSSDDFSLNVQMSGNGLGLAIRF